MEYRLETIQIKTWPWFPQRTIAVIQMRKDKSELWKTPNNIHELALAMEAYSGKMIAQLKHKEMSAAS